VPYFCPLLGVLDGWFTISSTDLRAAKSRSEG
jgi:hypothetical protein